MIDLFKGDDAYHGGAFMLAANFSFYGSFKPQNNPTVEPRKWPPNSSGARTTATSFFPQARFARRD